MPRAPRVHYPGAVYHVMARGVDGRLVFLDDSDRRRFLGTIHEIMSSTPFSLLAYCLMANHFHFALAVDRTPLCTIMHRLMTSYAMAFNLRYERQGHLFQSRYKARLCTDEGYLAALVRYIHENPVRAGICERAEQWPWSSGFGIKQTAAGALDGFEPWPSARVEAPPLLRRETLDESIDSLAAPLFDDERVRRMRGPGRTRSAASDRKRLIAAAMKGGHQITVIARWLGRTPTAVNNLMSRSNKLNKLRPDPDA